MAFMLVARQAGRLIAMCAIATLLFDVMPGSHAAGQTGSGLEAGTITLGVVAPVNQKEIDVHFRDFVRYVARKMAVSPALAGSVVVAPTQSELAKLLAERKVDFYFESPYPTYLINSVYGAGKLLLRRWKGGMADYYALIFTKRNSAITRLEDLRGHNIAFEDPGSTSGHFLPKFFLSRLGFKLSEKSRIEPNVSADEVSYVFAYSQDKLVDWVLTQRVAAGAFSNDDYNNLAAKKKSEIRVLAETERLPRHLVSVRKDLDPELVKRLETILLSMNENPEGRRILSRTDATTRFDPLPGGESAMRQRLLDTFYSSERK